MKLPGWLRRILAKVKLATIEAATEEVIGGLTKSTEANDKK